ncbi:MAG: BatD family protein [bacterium]
MLGGVLKSSRLMVLFLLTLAATAWADVVVTASVDRTEIYSDERVQLTVTVEGKVTNLPDISLPELPDFVSYSSGTSQNISFVNGKTQVTKSYNFVLAPTKTGTLTIPPMAMEIDGKQYTTPKFDITVNQGQSPGNAWSRSQPQQRRSDQPQPQQQQQEPQQVTGDDLFITTSIDKDTVYVNEQVTLSFKFYQADRVDITQNPDYQPPQKTGFWVEDLPPRETGYRVLNNRRYHVTEIKSGLFPTTAGEQEVGEAMLNVTVREPRNRRDPFSIFDDPFFGLSGRGRTIQLSSNPIKVVTLPLPDKGRPESFTGAVGNYRISASADKTSVEVNEPVTLTVRISGSGNIKSVALPEFPELPEFRSYRAGDSENMTKTNYRVGGTKTFEQVFIPKLAGVYTIPAVEFSFFDPKQEAYKTLVTDPVQIEVTPAQDRYASQVQNLESNKIDLVARDIRYLKSDIGEVNGGKSRLLAVHPLYLALYLLPLIGYGVVLTQKKRHEKLQTDVAFRRLKQARKFAEKRLKSARQSLDQGAANEFYANINRSMIEYFADRFDLPAFGLTADSIKEFASNRLPEKLTERLLDLLSQCDLGRFAPGGSEPQQMEQLWQQAKSLIVEMEKSR